MTYKQYPWYRRNHLIWMASIPIGIGLLIHIFQYRPFILLSSWLSTYETALYLLFVTGGGLAGLGAWVAHRRKTTRFRWISGGLVAASFLLISTVFIDRDRTYEREEVTFVSRNITLSGTLYRPRGDVTAGIVLVHGSPDFDRGFYHVWADFFAHHGMAVLSYDKRGTGRSGGVFVADNNTSWENLDLLAADVQAGLERLGQDADLASLPTGLWGLSQAGWIVPIAATRHPVDFVLLASGPTCTTEEEHVYSRITGDHAGAGTGSRAEAEEAVVQSGPGGFDPLPFLSQMEIPGLWVFGEVDDSIPVRRSTQLLDDLIAEGRPFAYHVLPNADHLLFSRAGFPDFAPEYWDITKAWLETQGLIQRRVK